MRCQRPRDRRSVPVKVRALSSRDLSKPPMDGRNRPYKLNNAISILDRSRGNSAGFQEAAAESYLRLRPSSSVESGASRPKRNNEQPVGLTADFGTTLAVLLESVFRRIEESSPFVRSRGVIPIFGSQTKPSRSVSSRGFDISNPSIMGPAQLTEHWAGVRPIWSTQWNDRR